jgi:hypothetical protein
LAGTSAGGQQQRVVVQVPALAQGQRRTGGVEPGGVGVQQELDAVVGIPAGRVDREVLRSGLAGEVVLGQWGTLVGGHRLVADDGHGTVEALGAKRAGR